ncbi:hypothetical protein [Streptomyces sp. NPDC046909]|uniref:hypothetical protein n=1 Tax=Streptomyces sp. NPDC046909 TaxID=3155617 RepID=UPI0033E482A1
MSSYDFFLAHAEPDAAAAEQLYRHLPGETHVFNDDRFLNELHQGLTSTQWQIRGQCALALSRIDGMNAHAALRRSYPQAGATQERILAALGLLSLGQELPGDPKLRRLRTDLARDSHQYMRLVMKDILKVLSTCQHPQATDIAAAWEGIYSEAADY